ncbi:hypothetical protein K474DRAFT_1098510 [Panus rudis PR-1116 ss-1]|nr:hypothetical protein K474DRAFT_1098510 [Panus rudis PR-1116 ss-1]
METPHSSSSQVPLDFPVDNGTRGCLTQSLPVASSGTNVDKPTVLPTSWTRNVSEASHDADKENQLFGAGFANLPHLRVIARALHSAASRERARSRSPLLALPTELLLIIFRFLADDETSSTLVRATHLCHRLRVTALSSPLLWTRAITNHLDCVVGFAERSQQQPLDAIVNLTRSARSPLVTPVEIDTRGLQRPELKSLRSLEIVAPPGMMRECLSHFPNQLPILQVLKLQVDSAAIRAGYHPPVVDFSLPPATNTATQWAIHTIEVRNLQFRYPSQCRHILPNLRVFKTEFGTSYNNVGNHTFPLDEFMDMVDDCPNLCEIRIANPGFIPTPSQQKIPYAPSLSNLTFVGGYSSEIMLNITVPRSASVYVEQWASEIEAPHPLWTHPAIEELDTIELNFVSCPGGNRVQFCAYTESSWDGTRAPLNISWSRSTPCVTSRHLESIMDFFQFAQIRRFIVRQVGRLEEVEWLVMLAARPEITAVQIIYFPDSPDLIVSSGADLNPFLTAMMWLVTSGVNYPSELKYVTFSGFPSQPFTVDGARATLRTLRDEGFSFQRITIEQRHASESQVSPDQWADVGSELGLEIAFTINSSLPRSILM